MDAARAAVASILIAVSASVVVGVASCGSAACDAVERRAPPRRRAHDPRAFCLGGLSCIDGS